MTEQNETGRQKKPAESRGSIVGGILSPVEFQSAIKQFVEPGSNVTKLLMRAFFRDEREMNASILLLRWVREYKLKDDEAMLLDRIAARTSLQGLRMHQVLQAVVGQLDGHRAGWKKILPGRKPPHDEYLNSD